VQGSLHIHQYHGTVGTLRNIYGLEGPQGLFRGLGTALFNVPLFWSIYWYSYENMKIYMKREYPTLPLPLLHISSAAISGGIADVITNPFWVVRTRIQTLFLHPESSSCVKTKMGIATPSTYQMFRSIYKEEGMFAFYKGITASFLGLPHVAIQFPLYEYLKNATKQFRTGDQNGMSKDDHGSDSSSVVDYFFASIVAKMVASSITYPHEVLRVRMQDMRSDGVGLYQLTKNIIKEEGVKALWSGFRVNMLRIIPSTTSTFITYEYVTKFLQEQQKYSY
jgi:hypothetical protein